MLKGKGLKWISGLIILIVVIKIAGCGKTQTPQEKLQAAVEAEGTDASITAGFLVSAMRQCYIVGLNVDDCAKLKGTLIDEQTAQTVAQLAVNQRTEYWKSCLASFSNEYCSQLLQRAVAIELRKPATSANQ